MRYSGIEHDINAICKFLARRDVSAMSRAALRGQCGIEKADVLFVFGCEVIPVVSCAVRAASEGLCGKIIFSGGVGHSTQNLAETTRRLFRIDCAGMPEAAIMARIAVDCMGLDPGIVLTEEKSTNSGENSRFSLEILRERGISPGSALLMQDPFMQLRSHLTLRKHLDPDTRLISYAPFIPEAGMKCGSEYGVWSPVRFHEFLLREIPRLRDDENGYGPKGAGFIEHVDIPDAVEESYRRLCAALSRG